MIGMATVHPISHDRDRGLTIGAFGPWILTLTLLACGHWAACAAAPSATGLPEVPEELRYQRISIPDEENAVTDWLKATPLLVPLEGPAKAMVRVAWTPGAKPPPPEEWAPVAAWVKQQADVLRLIEDGLRKPKAQWPLRRPEVFEMGLNVVRLGATARLATACMADRDGIPANSVDLILGTVKLAQMTADGEGALIHYLVGHSVRSLAHQAAQRLAAEPHPPAVELRRLLTGLPSLNDEPEVYARVLRVEFCDYVVKPMDALEVANQWTEAARTDAATMNLLVPAELQRAHAVFLTPSLVASHPLPYDHAAAVRACIPNYLRYLRNVQNPWPDQEEPPHDADETLVAFLEDAEDVLKAVEGEPLPLNREAADRARTAYNEFKNPVGRLFEAKPDVVDFSARRVFQARVEREATRTLIALRIHHLEHGNWPARLDELVEAKLLPTLPIDAFSGKPLHFDRQRLLIWSIGDDGEDNKGRSPAESRWQQDDPVWPVKVRE